MNFAWTTLHVRDLEASLKFYQEIVGLPLKRRFSPNGTVELAFLGNDGESELELYYKPGDVTIICQGISIGFMCQVKLEDLLEKVKEQGYAVVSSIESPNPFMRFVHVSDPDGYQVQLIEDSRS